MFVSIAVMKRTVIHHPECAHTEDTMCGSNFGSVSSLSYMVDFQCYYLTIARCMSSVGDHNIVQGLLESKHCREVTKFRNGAPRWDGGDMIWQLAFKYGYQHGLYIQVPVHLIHKIWMDDYHWQLEKDYDYSGNKLVKENLTYLGKQNLVSKRASMFEVTQADINKLLNHLNSKTNEKYK